MKRYLLGIDLGTTNVKGILFDEYGNQIAFGSATYDTLYPAPGQAEQDPLAWWEAVKKIISSILQAAGSEAAKNIASLCISSQTPTLLPVDRDGNPLRNAIIWMDKRSGTELEQILTKIAIEDYKAIAGGAPDVSFLPSKLLWYKTNEPRLFSKTHRFLQASSFINLKLTGVFSADLDQAALTQCLDRRTNQWSETIGSILDIDLDNYFPQPVPCNTIIGQVTREAAELTGLPPNIPVAAGTSDATASMFAVGISKPGDAAEVSGTSSLIFVGHTSQTDPKGSVVSKPCGIDGLPYVFDAPVSTTGASIKWYLDTLGSYVPDSAAASGKTAYDMLNEEALLSPAGSRGLLFFPYMAGERAPLWNTHARGMFIGLSLSTKREDMLRSIFEGTSFSLRHVLDEIKGTGAAVDSFRIAGGGALSRTWLRIKASVLNLPVSILDSKTGDVPFGDALIAGNAVGIYPSISEYSRQLIKVKEVIPPIPEWAAAYDKLFPYYISMYQSLDANLKSFEATVKNLHENLKEVY